MNFRCFFLNDEGHILSVESLVAETDADALRLAQLAFSQRNHYSAFELWHGERRLHAEGRTAA
jgi:hypothetical protein